MSLPPLLDAVMVHLGRFAIMLLVSEIALLVGVRGFAVGLTVNVAVTVFAAVLMTRRRLWRSSGALTRWRSWLTLAAVVPLAFEAITWALPAGLSEQAPGFALWGLTLLLVGVNEELVSRGVVLSRLRAAYPPLPAVALTGALFGLQHLSAFALSSRSAADILGNVGLSAVVGFAYAAFQLRFRWIWPLVLAHATADFTTILAARPLPVGWIAAAHVGLVAYGLFLLRSHSHDRVRR